MDTREQHEARLERFLFSVRLDTMFFPLAFSELRDIAGKAGFTLPERLRQIPQMSLPRGGVVVSGGIGEKPNTRFNVEPERSIVTVEGNKVDEVLADFDLIEELAQKEFSVDFVQARRFYEFIADLSILSSVDPIKAMARLSSWKLQSQFSKILGQPTTNFGVRLVKKGQPPDEVEWFDYRIEPLIAKSRSAYYSNVVYRSSDKTRVVKQAETLIDTVKALIAVIEGGLHGSKTSG